MFNLWAYLAQGTTPLLLVSGRLFVGTHTRRTPPMKCKATVRSIKKADPPADCFIIKIKIQYRPSTVHINMEEQLARNIENCVARGMLSDQEREVVVKAWELEIKDIPKGVSKHA